MPRTAPIILLALSFCLAAVQPALAEVFYLSQGGCVIGKWLNPDETPRKQYVVATEKGEKKTLDASEVSSVSRSPAVEEYERVRPSYADTAEAQWELAQWCRDHRLSKQRKTHMERVVALSPDHAEARRALGYTRQADGKWVTHDDIMTQRGYHRYKGRWMTQQEIDLQESKRKQEVAQQIWFTDLKRWRSWFGTKREEEAITNIEAIADPAAVKALDASLEEEQSVAIRLMLVDALIRIDTAKAAESLAHSAVFDASADVRDICLEHLRKKKRPEVISFFSEKLNPKKNDNSTINLAGVALGRMKDPEAIPAMIDALVTVHKYKISNPAGDNATSASFGSGGGMSGTGLSSGGGPKIIQKIISNQDVLDALVAMTGQNFNFDQKAWRAWYSRQKKTDKSINTRRN